MDKKIEETITKVLDEIVLYFHTKTNRDICIVALRMLTESAVEEEREILDACLELMDRARNILTNNKPTPDNNWGMLDTKFLRKDLKAIRNKKKRGGCSKTC